MSERSRLHVLVLIDSLGHGGAEFLLADFAQAAPLGDIELSVAYLQERDDPRAADRLRRLGVTPVHVPVTSLLLPRGLRSVRRHIRRVRPDVVHTHLGTSDWIGGLAARSLSVPVVSTVHIMAWERSLSNDLRVRLMAAGRRRCMAKVIGVSEEARRWLVKHRWARPDQAVTVYNGVVGAPRPGVGPEIRRQLRIPPGATVVTMLSVLRPEKAHDVGIAAVAAVRERRQDVHLVIVGDGPARPLVEARAAPLDGAVTMTGHRDDVMELLDATDVLLHPSHADAFPTALLEALAAGVPAVASCVGGIPEIVDHGVTGELVRGEPRAPAFAAALYPLIESPDRRRRLGQAGRLRFDRDFSAERWACRMREVYDAAVAGAPVS